jgi:5'(3')-deoxyribonucleotidase
MIIGIDVDDVLVEYVRAFLRFYNEKNKSNLSYEEFNNISNSVDKDNSFFNSNYFRGIEICWGARTVIKKLAEKNNLFIVTARQKEWKEFTDKFIQENFPNCFKGVFYAGDVHGGGKKKAEIYEGMDMIIEDNKGHALECAKRGMKVFLIERPWNKGIEHPNIRRVNQWEEILDLIEE